MKPHIQGSSWSLLAPRVILKPCDPLSSQCYFPTLALSCLFCASTKYGVVGRNKPMVDTVFEACRYSLRCRGSRTQMARKDFSLECFFLKDTYFTEAFGSLDGKFVRRV